MKSPIPSGSAPLVLALLLAAGAFAETIPYDPALFLGGIVPPARLSLLKLISAENQKVEAEEEKLNMLILAERSLGLTRSELVDMGVTDTKALDDKLALLKEDIKKAASALADARIKAYEAVARLKEQASGLVSSSFESPVDFDRTQIKSLPLSADSIKLNSQYFTFGKNEQNAQSAIASIKAFVSAETATFLGGKKSAEATAAVQSQLSHQVEHHEVLGTLVITANCTHKNASMLSPFVLDVDRAIATWNQVFPDQRIDPQDEAGMAKLLGAGGPAGAAGPSGGAALALLSGATYGSSFVGMVHYVKASDTEASQAMGSVAASLQSQATVGNFLSNAKGGFGVDASVATDMKDLLSSQSVSSHVTVYCVGAIPTIVANEVKIAVERFAQFDPKAAMEQLAVLANSTSAAKATVQGSATAARTGGQLMSIKDAEIKSVMTGLAEIELEKNRTLDMTSLMTAFEDYARKAAESQAGVPLSYQLKAVTAAEIAELWLAKYHPEMLEPPAPTAAP